MQLDRLVEGFLLRVLNVALCLCELANRLSDERPARHSSHRRTGAYRRCHGAKHASHYAAGAGRCAAGTGLAIAT